MIDLHCNKLLPRSTFQCTALYFHKPPSFAYFLAILHMIHHKRSIILPSSYTTVSRSHHPAEDSQGRSFQRWYAISKLCSAWTSTHISYTQKDLEFADKSSIIKILSSSNGSGAGLCKQSSDHMTPKLTHRTLGCACQRLISTSASSRYFAQTWIPPHNEPQH